MGLHTWVCQVLQCTTIIFTSLWKRYRLSIVLPELVLCYVSVSAYRIQSSLWLQVNTQLLRYIVFILYLITFCVGAIGNTVTIVAIAVNQRLKRSAATCFMLNLAVADDLFILSLPFMAHSTLTRRWAFGAGLCKLLSVLHGVSVLCVIRYDLLTYIRLDMTNRGPYMWVIGRVTVIVWSLLVLRLAREFYLRLASWRHIMTSPCFLVTAHDLS